MGMGMGIGMGMLSRGNSIGPSGEELNSQDAQVPIHTSMLSRASSIGQATDVPFHEHFPSREQSQHSMSQPSLSSSLSQPSYSQGSWLSQGTVEHEQQE
mmetsp:Transcript_47984/g.95761  ORF Transcript_47984/g.95761 Transcript_47984/m.95761 type:complete len:99 (+) Transcript_47984:3-299(+)